LEAYRRTLQAAWKGRTRPVIKVCGGTGCRAHSCTAVADAFRSEVTRQGLAGKVELKVTGCPGLCERGPIVVVDPAGVFYQRVKAEDAAAVVSETALKGKVIDRLLYTAPDGRKLVHAADLPFYQGQMRLVFAHNGDIDPLSIEDYIATGGYAALPRALFDMTPERIIDEVKRSGVRGRGGAGFPAGTKWESVRRARGDIKYVIANGNEGDPCNFANRFLMEGNPHSILEGLIIGAFAMGAHEGFLFIRSEFDMAVEHCRQAIAQAEALGLLGKDILGSGFDLSVTINRGGGAFVCGESTAVMASLEGRIGEPRVKYVHNAEKGLKERPSDLNNVETWADIPLIINRGGDWFRAIGSEGNSGTKAFSLVGAVNDSGLVEVPLGTSLRKLIFDIGGGIRGGRPFKAVQTGGPAGGFIPASLLDLPVDFDELTKAGSMIGSGGMIVMDDRSCMVDVARYFFTFLEEESCGKCFPCREGIKRMGQLLGDISRGKGRLEDLAYMERLAAYMGDSSICALGQTASNPLLAALRYFREEFEAHIRDKRCPAGVCKALVRYDIDREKCNGCGRCVTACPRQAITSPGRRKPVVIDHRRCNKCGECLAACEPAAITVE
jgi:NADH-quinone oxidoreductase subunit F